MKRQAPSLFLRAGSPLLAIAALTVAACVMPARAEYPERPVRIVVPYGPGGVADVTTRVVAQKLAERLGKQFIVDNRPGPGSISAALAVLSSPRDGYTLFLTGNGPAISVSLFKSLPYDLLRDFSSISMFATFDVLVATKEGSEIDSIAALIAYDRANPGRLNLGTIAPGTTQHLSAELFRILTGVSAAAVTYRSSPDIVTALVRGDIDVAFDYLAAFQPALANKTIRLIASGGDKVSARLPGVPTVKGSGYPDYSATSWNALAAPRGVAVDIVAKLNRAVNEVLKDPEVQQRAEQFGMEIVGSTPEELTERTKSDIVKWGQVIDKIGLAKQ